jgi:hypothetical protein
MNNNHHKNLWDLLKAVAEGLGDMKVEGERWFDIMLEMENVPTSERTTDVQSESSSQTQS